MSVPHMMEMFLYFLLLLSHAVIPCEPPPVIANGQISSTQTEYVFGLAVTYTCDEGFSLIGSSMIYCTADAESNGIWSGPAPECKGRCFLSLLTLFTLFLTPLPCELFLVSCQVWEGWFEYKMIPRLNAVVLKSQSEAGLGLMDSSAHRKPL